MDEKHLETEDILTTEEAAKFLHISVRTLFRQISKGIIPVYKLGNGRKRYLKTSDLLHSLTRKSVKKRETAEPRQVKSPRKDPPPSNQYEDAMKRLRERGAIKPKQGT